MISRSGDWHSVSICFIDSVSSHTGHIASRSQSPPILSQYFPILYPPCMLFQRNSLAFLEKSLLFIENHIWASVGSLSRYGSAVQARQGVSSGICACFYFSYTDIE
jgi:hypothetical protein